MLELSSLLFEISINAYTVVVHSKVKINSTTQRRNMMCHLYIYIYKCMLTVCIIIYNLDIHLHKTVQFGS